MTGLFEIWQFSCICKKALINSQVGRNVSWDYLVRGVFLPAGLPYRLSCVYRCLQVHCSTAEQDNSCWILDSCAVKFELWGLAKTVKHFQNSEINLNGWFNILGKSDFQTLGYATTSFLTYLESKYIDSHFRPKKCFGVQEWIDLTRKSMKGKRPACLFHHASYMPPSFSLPLSRLSARQNHAQSRASLFKICLDLHNVIIEGRI